MIPELVGRVLPQGIHECTVDEVGQAFGRFWRSDRRIRLTEKLRNFVEEARKSAIVAAVVIDGSYVTAKAEPNDIDLIVALRPDFDLAQELRPFEYNILSRRRVKEAYRFDLPIALDGSPLYREHLAFFSCVRPDDPELSTGPGHKGLLRISL